MFTKETIAKEFKRIQDSVPMMMKEFTLVEVEKTPAIKMVMEKALENPTISQEKKDKIKRLLDAGVFSKKTIHENPKIAKQRDEYVIREIRKSVKAGRLPTKKKLKELGLEFEQFI